MDSEDGYVETDLPEAFYEWFLKNVNVMVFSPEQVVDVLPTND